MTRYLVTWEIDEEAETPLAAVLDCWREYFAGQSVRDNTACVFEVREIADDGTLGKHTTVDLLDLEIDD